MLPALTATPRRITRRRVGLGAAAALLAVASVAAALPSPPPPPPPPALADALAPATWAMQIPTAWIAATPDGVRPGDLIDVIALRAGDRGYAVPVAYALRVMSIGGDGLVVEVDEDDAIALATARSAGLLVLPILRSSR